MLIMMEPLEVVFGSRDNRVYMLNGTTGAIKAVSRDTGGDIDCRPVVLPGRQLVIGNDTGSIFSMSTTDMGVAWQSTAGAEPINASLVAEDLLSSGSTQILSFGMSGLMRIFSTLGDILVSYNASAGIEGTPLVMDIDQDGKVEILWTTLAGQVQLLRWTNRINEAAQNSYSIPEVVPLLKPYSLLTEADESLYMLYRYAGLVGGIRGGGDLVAGVSVYTPDLLAIGETTMPEAVYTAVGDPLYIVG
jgi:hypothetical protein